jgi:DNA-binding CsgD family transcriptional regulator
MATTKLSPRQLQILHYIAIGLTKPQVSEVLSLSFETIKSQTVWIRIKLGVHTMAGAVAIAYDQGVLTTHSVENTRYLFRQYQEKQGTASKIVQVEL